MVRKRIGGGENIRSQGEKQGNGEGEGENGGNDGEDRDDRHNENEERGCMQKKLWRHLQREKIRLIINMLLMMKSKSQIHGELKINKVL